MVDLDSTRPPIPIFARATALLNRGEVICCEDQHGPFYMYMAALNSSERDEAAREALLVAARTKILIDPESKEMKTLLAELNQANRDQIIEQLLTARSTEAWGQAQDDLLADDNWRGDRIDAMTAGNDRLLAGAEVSDEERAALTRVNQEYVKAWKDLTVKRLRQMRASYDDVPTDQLIEDYVTFWRTARCARQQMDTYETYLLFFGARICEGRRLAGGVIDHSACNGHMDRLFPSVDAVRRAGDELRGMLLSVANRLEKEGGAALGKLPTGIPG